jgi:hypothetical protein
VGGKRAKERDSSSKRERRRQTHFELSGTTATTTRLQLSKASVHKYTQIRWDAFANAQSLAISQQVQTQ